MTQLESTKGLKIKELANKSLKDIIVDANSSDKEISEYALEALAFHLMHNIGMKYAGIRHRRELSEGMEVELMFESAQLFYSRWQVLCNNEKCVSVDSVATEVGLLHVLKSNAIVIITTGTFSNEVKHYRNEVMETSNISIALIDKNDIQLIIEDPSNIVKVLKGEANNAMQIKGKQYMNVINV